MNAPDRYELFVLGEGERKVEVVDDTKVPNAATITLAKEDHTIAGALRAALVQDPNVIFAGYRVPHPLEPRVVLRVQTTDETTPVIVLQEAIRALIVQLGKLRSEWDKEARMARARTAAGATGPDYASAADPAAGFGGGAGGMPDYGAGDGFDGGMDFDGPVEGTMGAGGDNRGW